MNWFSQMEDNIEKEPETVVDSSLDSDGNMFALHAMTQN